MENVLFLDVDDTIGTADVFIKEIAAAEWDTWLAPNKDVFLLSRQAQPGVYAFDLTMKVPTLPANINFASEMLRDIKQMRVKKVWLTTWQNHTSAINDFFNVEWDWVRYDPKNTPPSRQTIFAKLEGLQEWITQRENFDCDKWCFCDNELSLYFTEPVEVCDCWTRGLLFPVNPVTCLTPANITEIEEWFSKDSPEPGTEDIPPTLINTIDEMLKRRVW